MFALCIAREWRRAVIIAFAGFALSCAGCLEGEKTVSATYDQAKDQFSFLVVYQNIRSGVFNLDDAQNQYHPELDLPYLQSLYSNRDHLILLPLVFGFVDGGLGSEAVLTRDAKHAGMVDLSEIKPEVDIHNLDVDLHDLQVTPGHLFLRDGSLCFGEQITVPHAMIDALIDSANRAIVAHPPQMLMDMFDYEIGLRRERARKPTWDRFTQQTVQQLMDDLDNQQGPDTWYRLPLDMSSMQTLRLALQSGNVKIQRRQQTLFVRLRMSAADVEGACICFDTVRTTLRSKTQVMRQRHAANLADAQQLQAFFDAINVGVIKNDTLEIAVDVPRFFEGFPAPTAPAPEVDAQHLAWAHDMARLAAEGGLVDSQMTIQKLQDEFTAGKITAFPATQPATPGLGLGTIKVVEN